MNWALQEKERAEDGNMVTKSSSFSTARSGYKADQYEYALDGSVDFRGRPAAKGKTGGWVAGSLVLGNYFIIEFQISFIKS